MRKKIAGLLASQLLLMSLAVPQVFALDIQITKTGRVYFFQDGVLGKTSDKPQTSGATPFRTLINERITLTVFENSVTATIGENLENTETETEHEQDNEQEDEQEVEEVERVRVQLPAGQTEKQQQIQEMKEKAREAKKEEIERRKAEARRAKEAQKESAKAVKEQYKRTAETARESWKNASAEAKEKAKKTIEQAKELRKQDLERIRESSKSAYIKRLEEERRIRINETIEVRSIADDDGDKALELVSKEVRSKISGATFSVDAETNAIILTTPSGVEHTLNHLPDQALERIRSLPQVREGELVSELTIEPEGNVVKYKTTIETKKKFLGIFPREIETEVTLDDTSGAIETTKAGEGGFFDSILDVLSF